MTHEPRFFTLGPNNLPAILRVPDAPKGLVVFAHGSGSGHRSPRNNQVADALSAGGFATLLFDLLTVSEERDRRNVFDIELLATRLIDAIERVTREQSLAGLPVGLFGASTGGGAAIRAASRRPDLVGAVVSRGGRPDLAGGDALRGLRAPTQLIVGGADHQVIELNRDAAEQMRCLHEIVIVPGAGHLFEEPGTLAQVVDHAKRWFTQNLVNPARTVDVAPTLPLEGRVQAGQMLADRLAHLRGTDPIVLALPRGGLPVAFPIARALGADLDLLMVRKLGAPGHEEFAIGAVVDGDEPQVVFNEDAMKAIAPSREYVQRELDRQIAELERRRRAYIGDREKPQIAGRTVIIVDDGVATGSTIMAALRGARRNNPHKLILAVPVAPPDVVRQLGHLCDEIVVLATPDPFYAVGNHYRDFRQVDDQEVIDLLAAADRASMESR